MTKELSDNIIPEISIIIPVYNEEKSVGLVLKILKDVVFYPYEAEIIVVDDGSTDNSANVIKKFHYVKYIRHRKNLGKGAALKTGFNQAKGKVIVIQDADMEYSPDLIPKIVKPILFGEADVVFGSRFKGKYEGMTFSHYFGNRILSLTASIFFQNYITDIMTGSKAFGRSVTNLFDLRERGFEVEIEMTSQSLFNGWKYKEVPISYSYRKEGISKIGPLDGLRSILRIFQSYIKKN